MSTRVALGLSLLLLVAGGGLAIAEFATVGAAPCDPSLPVLSDGTRAAPSPWAFFWLAFTVGAAACVGGSVGLLVDTWRSSRAGIGVGVGAAALVLAVLWVGGAAYWSTQCPV